MEIAIGKTGQALQGAVATVHGDQVVRLWWLGQAGFALRYGDFLAMIDPYLSDHLAAKYRGSATSHDRLMPAPLEAERVAGLDAVLCSHEHSDHMDPEALPILAGANPACRFVVPAAHVGRAVEIGLPAEAICGVNAGRRLSLAEGVDLEVIPSAHEQLETDADGRYGALGYIITLGDVKLYHSGDCVPYDGLGQTLASKRIDLALLPVNGRDERRRALGVAGNFTVGEAVELCQAAGISQLICHHFGMFAFNTLAAGRIERYLESCRRPVSAMPAQIGVTYHLGE